MNAYTSVENQPVPLRHTRTFIDVFAGCGGLSLGLMKAGWRGLFAVEHDANAFQTLHDNLIASDPAALPAHSYKFAWPEWLEKAPIGVTDLLSSKRAMLEELAGKVDMLVGGPPCQGFSTAGRRDPSDPRNRLVAAYLEMVEILRPAVVLIENVRGITSDFRDDAAPDGKTNYAARIKTALSEHYVVSTRMVDTSQFGVPQKRHRFFVIGIRKGVATACHPFDALDAGRLRFLRQNGIASVPVSARLAISDLELTRNGTRPSPDTAGFEEIAYKGPVTTYQQSMNLGLHGHLKDTRLARHKPAIESRFRTLIALCQADGRLNTALSAETRASFGLKKCAIRVMDPDMPAPTVTSMPDDLIHYSEPRALTVRENARLQSFPDWFEFRGKYTTGGVRRRREVPRFTQVANAVPPLMAEAVGLAISRTLESATADTAQVGTFDQRALDTLEERP